MSARPRNASRPATSRLEVIERSGQGTLWIAYRVRDRGRDGQPELHLKALQVAPNRHPRLPRELDQALRRWQSATFPLVCAPLEIGQEDGTFFYTAPLLRGPSLETRLQKGAFSPEEALRHLESLAQTLEGLHRGGFFHGDIRPRQLIFGDTNRLHLTDGGVAEAFFAAGLSQLDVQPEAAYYLAPERAPSSPPTAPADIYALGIVFFRMLTGRLPFEGASVVAVAGKHRTQPVPLPSQFNPRLSPALDALCARLLLKDPANRPTATQILNDLEEQNLVSATPKPIPTAPVGAPAPTPAPVAPANSSANTPAPANAPKRRSLDALVDEQMAKEAEEKSRETLEGARKRHRKREFWGFFGALLWLLLLLGAGGGGAYAIYKYWLLQIPVEVRVPQYVGLSQDQARQTLAKKGLMMRVVRESYDPSKPEGTVLVGEPEPGRKVRARREVFVTVSAGRAPIKMVDFSRLTLAQARKIITQHGLRLGSVVEQYHESVPAQFICGQFPEPGDPLRRSDPITLIVSRGPQPREIDATQSDAPQGDIADQPLPNDAETGASDNSDLDLAPLEGAPAQTSPTDDPSAPQVETERAAIRVEVPEGGSQNVRIIVRDSGGERTVYQEVKAGGSKIRQTVSVSRPAGEKALVRVYIDEVLVREEEL